MPVGTVVLLSMLVQVGLHSEARFRLPIIPLVCLFFGYGLHILLKWRSDRSLIERGKVRAAAGLISVVVILYGLTGWLFLNHKI
jgi:hypothetical protein